MRQPTGPFLAALLALGLTAGLTVGCADTSEVAGTSGAAAPSEVTGRTPAPSPSPPPPSTPPSPSPSATTSEPASPAAVPEPRRSFVTIEALGLRGFPVVRYRGAPDDAAGTALQDAGEMASPRGRVGGVGPGEVGNLIVTGHRLTGTAPLRDSPSLRRGDRIRVRTGDTVHVYEVRRTRWTSFRSRDSLAAQRAPVPGRPGRAPTRAMITLSTCATPEDHAAGNYWADEFDNPEHRIDKIGVLVATRPA